MKGKNIWYLYERERERDLINFHKFIYGTIYIATFKNVQVIGAAFQWNKLWKQNSCYAWIQTKTKNPQHYGIKTSQIN